MFGIDNEKLITKLNEVVLPKMVAQDPEDVVKYNLALKYLIEMSDFKKIGCMLGMFVGSTTFLCTSGVIIPSAGATFAIASTVVLVKTHTVQKQYKKLFGALLIGLRSVHLLEQNEVQEILNKITADDLVDFLERECLTENNNAE
jgi:hypothetical protein